MESRKNNGNVVDFCNFIRVFRDNNSISAGDIPFADDTGVPLYLLTPSGVLKCYDSLSLKQWDIPWDPNS